MQSKQSPSLDFGTLTLATIVCDYNGTLAEDGVLLPGVQESFPPCNSPHIPLLFRQSVSITQQEYSMLTTHHFT
ncbi:MAG: hypothetical protein D3921_05780 [Candidatus Electrothrix sp. AW1]|nr:hypothetical protein [Candidatus Electrothrix sp. AX1]MCI5182012.1 hypothetical protein [Candidatus Electrothrix gigas]